MKRVVLALIGFYRRFISPLSGPKCRFHPSCSAYGTEAVARHGAGPGLVLTLHRLLRCHPWSAGPWIDPVPERFAWADLIRYNRTQTNSRNDKPARDTTT